MTMTSRRSNRLSGQRSSTSSDIVRLSDVSQRRLRAPLRVRLKGPAGGAAVVLAAETYDRMVDRLEVLEARLAYARTRNEESFPAEVARRLVQGESPIRVFRAHRGLTQQALAAAVGKSKGYVSEIEAGKKRGSTTVLKAIAETLGVAIDDLV
ncbi:MAG: XRE family transcriptional regulator [Rhodospirillales bacterium]|nr:XRE family transcriptional regulator [Rhodospirillales bacterium]